VNEILPFFPLEEPRPKQRKACEYIRQKIEEGFNDIVIAAPTGAGKSAIGVCAGTWIASHLPASGYNRGAYYLVTQKLLQDQITDDVPRYREVCQKSASIKTSEEYECPEYGDCGAGMRISAAAGRFEDLSEEKKARLTPDAIAKKSKRCSLIGEGGCAYRIAKAQWLSSTLSITNYSFFFTAKMYTMDIKPRQMLICDECHSLEEQIIRFVDGAVSLSQVKKWLGAHREIPKFDHMDQYVPWIKNVYVPELKQVYENLVDLESLSDNEEGKVSNDIVELDKYICKLNRAVAQLTSEPDNWVFWREETKDGSDLQYIIRPVFGAPFVKDMITSIAPVRLYLSAYPGVSGVFCRNLGLDHKKVAWATMGSDFPLERRRVHYYSFGSMGSSQKADTLPSMLRAVIKIAAKHQDRGLIHCNSYELGTQIQEALINGGMGERVIFPKNSEEREAAFQRHNTTEGAILISPSMQEGFDFNGDKARWQVIPKVPYPYLGDKQIKRKLELDEEWYTMRTVMTILQACGRICRSATDYGVTYILDSDFKRLWKKADYMIPQWYRDAVIFHD
jgi:ATP-dependent DNA helicase DinG